MTHWILSTKVAWNRILATNLCSKLRKTLVDSKSFTIRKSTKNKIFCFASSTFINVRKEKKITNFSFCIIFSKGKFEILSIVMCSKKKEKAMRTSKWHSEWNNAHSKIYMQYICTEKCKGTILRISHFWLEWKFIQWM